MYDRGIRRIRNAFVIIITHEARDPGLCGKITQKADAGEELILPPLLQGLEPETFRSRVWRSNH